MNGIGGVPRVHRERITHECSQVIRSLGTATVFIVFFGEKDISTTLAWFTFVSTNVWPGVIDFDLTPALLSNFGVWLFSEAETSVRAFGPAIISLLPMFPLGQIIKLVNCFLSDWVDFGTIVESTWALASIG